MSIIQENIYLPDDPQEMRDYLEKNWYDMVLNFRGTIREWTPTIYGSSTAGTTTYSGTPKGIYIRTGLMVDAWFAVAWTNQVGGVGNLQLGLPLKVWASLSDFWVGECTPASITFANVLDTYCAPVAVNNTYNCDFVSGRHNAAKGYVGIQATGSLVGHIRYIGQENS